MKIIIQNLLVAMLLMVFAFQSHSQGVIDQESDTTPINPLGNGDVDGLYLSDEPAEFFTQSFIPSESAIDFVSLEFENGTGAASVYVNIYSSSPDARQIDLIGTSETVTLPSGFENNGLYDAGVATFDFSTPVTLTADDTYYIEALCSSGGAQWAIVTLSYDAYPNGQLFADGSAFNHITDFWFQEGISAVPEPNALALIMFGCILMLFLFKHRSKLVVLLLFASPVLPAYSADSVVQATASDAGLSSVSATSLPENGGTYWISSINPNGGLTTLPYPFLPIDMSDLPIFSITNQIYLVDDTHGDISPSSETMSRADASATITSESQSVESIIDLAETPPSPPTNGETDGGNGLPEPNGLTPTSDTTNIWLLATNEASNLEIFLNNASGDNYQLLSTTNLITANATNWDLGQILFGPSGNYNAFNPVPYTNTMEFFRVHQANPIMETYNTQSATEPNPTNSDPGQVGNFYISNEGSQTNDMTVYYSLSGTATNGVDYSNIMDSVVVSNSLGYALINIDPIADGLKPNQTIILSINQNTNYLIDPANNINTNTLFANPQVYPVANGDVEGLCPNNNSITFTLNASGPAETYSIATWPTHGTLNTNSMPTVTYADTNCYEGQDRFTFTANNGTFTSQPATVTLNIADQVFFYSPIYAQTCRGIPVNITLTANDTCSGEALNYIVPTNTSHGSVTGTPPNIVYTPTGTNFTGFDSFNYVAYSKCGSSATNTVIVTVGDNTISVTSENWITGTNEPVTITLSAASSSDCFEDTNDYIYAIISEPANGTLTNISGANLTYMPAANFEGVDSFQVVVSDGIWTNAPAPITVDVTAGPILFQGCNPFGTNVVLDWMLDTNEQQMSLNIQDYIVYRSTYSGGPYIAIVTNSAGNDTYTETNNLIGPTNYYVVTFQAKSATTGLIVESPRSNQLQASGQNPDNFISANSYWEVVVNTNYPNVVTNLQAPFSSYYPTNQYPGISPWPNSFWAVGTVMSNYTTFVIPTNTDLSQVQYSIAIDNNYYLYLNDSNAPIEYFHHELTPTWSTFKTFESVAPGLLHCGTNSVRLEIIDEGFYNYFSMVVTTNTCGY